MRGYHPRTPQPFESLLREVARVEQLPVAHVRRTLAKFIDLLPLAVWGRGRISVPGLAVFKVRSRKPRNIANPQTGELMQLPRARVVVARVAGAWRSRGV